MKPEEGNLRGAVSKDPPTSYQVKKQTLDELLDPSDAFPPARLQSRVPLIFDNEISETEKSEDRSYRAGVPFGEPGVHELCYEAVIVPQL